MEKTVRIPFLDPDSLEPGGPGNSWRETWGSWKILDSCILRGMNSVEKS